MKKEDSVGSRLKKARLSRGLALDDVYKNLRIHPRILESLEEDRTDLNLGAVYVKSFLKKYAGYLGLETDKLSDEFEKRTPLKKETQAPVFAKNEEKSGTKDAGKKEGAPYPFLSVISDRFTRSLFPIFFILAVIVGVAAIGYGGFRLRKELNKFRFAAAESVKTAEGSKTETAKAPAEAGKVLTAWDQPLVLEITTKDEVWLKVESDGKAVFQHTLSKNAKESWQAKERFEIKTARPNALELTLNGKKLVLPKEWRARKIIVTRQGLSLEKK